MQEPQLVEQVQIQRIRQAHVFTGWEVVRVVLEALVNLRNHDDRELALLRDAGLVDESTAICTTVHPLSVVDDALLPMTPTDSTVDYIVTETETLRATSPQSGPTGIQWDLLEADQIESIPILAMLNAARTPGSAE